MLIGYLQLSPPQDHESGIARYGRYIAEAVQQHPQLETREVVLELSDQINFRPALKQALKTFQDCDVLHVQYSKYVGLTGWNKLCLLKIIRQRFKGRLCMTLHDVYADLYPAYGLKEAWEFENKRLRGFSKNQSLALRSTATYLWQNYLADQAIIKWILTHCDQLIVCNQTEAERLQHFEGAEKLTVIPHFVESRSLRYSPAEAKATLGFGPEKIITLQGFVYRSKGHSTLLNALSLLSEDYKVVFAGGMAPNQDAFKRELDLQIKQLRLGDRVTFTGYLPEDKLELYLAATDLAVCPFKIASASGSLSTWISMERPTLAHALPQIEELNDLVPGSIALFKDYSPDTLAKAIRSCFPDSDTAFMLPTAASIRGLKQRLSLARIAREHIAIYGGEALGGEDAGGEDIPPPTASTQACVSSAS